MSAEPIPNRQSDAFEMLAELSVGMGDVFSPLGDVARVDPRDMPESYQRLLVHDDHMTPTLKRHHGEAVGLRVLAYHASNRWYRRKILLTTGGGRDVVEFGLVRLDLTVLDNAVRRAVLEREQPLGDILLNHGIMTHVEPMWFVRFEGSHPISNYFAAPSGPPCFGRLGVIHCNGVPAMELLEVVTDAKRTRRSESP